MAMGLTAKQRELLIYLQERESCPSYEQMRNALGLVSNSSVQRLVSSLEERGYIQRLRNRARAIEVLRPIQGGLRVVFGPEHWELRAKLKRARYAAEQQAA